MTDPSQARLLKIVLLLSIFTIFYNIVEGLVSIYFGIDDDTLVLLGFGVDSFVEVVSGIGIAHMVWRMKHAIVLNRDRFEKTALRITGISFLILAVGLVTGAVISFIKESRPETTLAGIVISLVSISTMYLLMYYKLKVGRSLNSDAIIADAYCTKTCFYLSIILLVSSGIYEILKIPYIDQIGSLGIAYFAFREGLEAFEKVKSKNIVCSSC